MEQLSIVVWKWGTKYTADHVNKMYSMLRRNLHAPFKLYCITDDCIGMFSDIRILTWPFGSLGRARRLRLFDSAVQERLGPRILQLDLDCVITGDITPLVVRAEPFIIWESVHDTRWVIGTEAPGYIGGALCRNTKPKSNPFNASMFLMDAGTMPTLWDDYLAQPDLLEARAKKAGHWTALVKEGKGTLLDAGDDDQAVLTLYAKKLSPATWGEGDGIYKYKRIKPGLPDNARIVFFQGRDIMAQSQQSPWILQHWK